jgi:hypothetical protein
MWEGKTEGVLVWRSTLYVWVKKSVKKEFYEYFALKNYPATLL